MTESPVLGRVREQFADLEQSTLWNEIFLGARSHLSSECLKRTHRLLIRHHMHTLRVYGHRRWRRSPCQVSTSIKQFEHKSFVVWGGGNLCVPWLDWGRTRDYFNYDMNKTQTWTLRRAWVPPRFQTPLRWNYYHWPGSNLHPRCCAQRVTRINALVWFFSIHVRRSRTNFNLPSGPSSALRLGHWDVVGYSEVEDSLHVTKRRLT